MIIQLIACMLTFVAQPIIALSEGLYKELEDKGCLSQISKSEDAQSKKDPIRDGLLSIGDDIDKLANSSDRSKLRKLQNEILSSVQYQGGFKDLLGRNSDNYKPLFKDKLIREYLEKKILDNLSFSSAEAKSLCSLIYAKAERLIDRLKMSSEILDEFRSDIIETNIEKEMDSENTNSVRLFDLFVTLIYLTPPDVVQDFLNKNEGKEVANQEKTQRLLDLSEKVLTKISKTTADDFYKYYKKSSNKPLAIKSFAKTMVSIACCPFIPEEVQLRIVDIYRDLIIKLAQDGGVSGWKNGFIWPGVVKLTWKPLSEVFVFLSELPEKISFLDLIAYSKKLFGIEKDKYVYEVNEKVLNKLKSLEKEIESEEILRSLSFGNPFHYLLTYLRCSYNDALNVAKEFQLFSFSFWWNSLVVCGIEVITSIAQLIYIVDLAAWRRA